MWEIILKKIEESFEPQVVGKNRLGTTKCRLCFYTGVENYGGNIVD